MVGSSARRGGGMADAADLKSAAARREGSNPSPGTNLDLTITRWTIEGLPEQLPTDCRRTLQYRPAVSGTVSPGVSRQQGPPQRPPACREASGHTYRA